VDDSDWLARRFEEHRAHLRGVAFRVLGSAAEADDAVQEAWIRLSRSDHAAVENLGGWLTTVVARVSLDMLRSRQARREHDDGAVELASGGDGRPDPEDQVVLVDAVGAALLMVLDTLGPDERLAFVLHDTFGVPFEEIGTILDRSPDAAKQLAHRARRKVRGVDHTSDPDPARQRLVVEAFLAASRGGDFDALVALLHPDVVLRADLTAVRMGAIETVTGAPAVAATFSGRAQAATLALIDGRVGLVWAVGGRPRVVWELTVQDGRVVAIDMIADPDHLAVLEPRQLP
jgi:RNA polymerase sigma-70 factor (ECF subfamily)